MPRDRFIGISRLEISTKVHSVRKLVYSTQTDLPDRSSILVNFSSETRPVYLTDMTKIKFGF